MATAFDRIIMILEQRSRPTSDGQIVVPMSVLEDVLGALGCVRRSLLPKHRQALNVMERRVGEYDISAVVAVCDFFKKRLSSVEQAAIFRLRDRLLVKSRLATPETHLSLWTSEPTLHLHRRGWTTHAGP